MKTTDGDTDERPGRPAKVRLENRIARLQDLLDSGIAETAQNARRQVWHPNPKIETVPHVAVRSRLLLVTKDHPGSTRIQDLSASKSAALQVLLLALFELQVRPPRARDPRTRLPIAYSDNPTVPTWVDFTALPTVDRTKKLTHPRTAKANRERQIKRALDRLADCGRVQIQAERVHGRYENFAVLDEGANNTGQGNRITYYARPGLGRGKARRQVVRIPVEFFLNGWVDALSDSEIITYLTLRLMSQAFPNRHTEGGVFLTLADRLESFNLERGFEAHRMLSRYGLINTIRDRRRNADGTMTDFEDTGPGEIHRFTLDDSMLAQPAIPRVITSLNRFALGLDSDLARLSDAVAHLTPAQSAS